MMLYWKMFYGSMHINMPASVDVLFLMDVMDNKVHYFSFSGPFSKKINILN